MRPDEEFAPLRIMKKNLTDFNRCAYRVYKSPSEYVTVEAATALEAFRESGIRNPLRILRETRFMERLVDQTKFTEIEELIETGVLMAPPMAITGHQEAVPQAQPRAALPSEFEQQTAAQITQKPQPQSQPEPEPDLAPEPQMAAPEAEPVPAEQVLSEDEIAKLLGDDG